MDSKLKLAGAGGLGLLKANRLTSRSWTTGLRKSAGRVQIEA